MSFEFGGRTYRARVTHNAAPRVMGLVAGVAREYLQMGRTSEADYAILAREVFRKLAVDGLLNRWRLVRAFRRLEPRLRIRAIADLALDVKRQLEEH